MKISETLAIRALVVGWSVFWALAALGLLLDLLEDGATPSRSLFALLFGPPAVGLLAVAVSVVRSRIRRASLTGDR